MLKHSSLRNRIVEKTLFRVGKKAHSVSHPCMSTIILWFMWYLRALRFVLYGARLSCSCILVTCMVVPPGILQIVIFEAMSIYLIRKLIISWFLEYSPELAVYAYAAAQVKKAIDVRFFLLTHQYPAILCGLSVYISFHSLLFFCRSHII